MGTRKEVREALAVLLAARAEFTEVFDHAPLDLRGKDRVLCIYVDNSHYEMISGSMNNDFHRFVLEAFALRRINAATAEDAIDEMREAIRQVVRANVSNAGVWNELNLESDSEALFAQIATEPYRIERHFVLVKVTN
jgi:hypothetical protein